MDKESLRRSRPDGRPRRQGLGKAARRAQQHQAHARRRCPDHCDCVEIGFGEIGISKWSMDYCRMQPCSVRALGDTALGVPELTRLCKRAHRRRRQARSAASPSARRAIGRRHDEVWAKWQEEARKDWDASPITLPRLALEIWDVIKDEDWVLTANNLKQQVRKLWDFDKPYRHPGVELGTADPDRHLARGRARAQGHRPHRGRHPARRRPDVRRRRALGRRQVPDPDADRDAQQPRLLQRLGAPDPHGASCAAPTRPRRISAWTCSARSRISPRSPAPWAATAKARSTSHATSARRSSARSPR